MWNHFRIIMQEFLDSNLYFFINLLCLLFFSLFTYHSLSMKSSVLCWILLEKNSNYKWKFLFKLIDCSSSLQEGNSTSQTFVKAMHVRRERIWIFCTARVPTQKQSRKEKKQLLVLQQEILQGASWPPCQVMSPFTIPNILVPGPSSGCPSSDTQE